MSSISNAPDLYSELHSLELSPCLLNGKVRFASKPPEHLMKLLQTYKDEFISILKEIDESKPGVCTRCFNEADDLFTVHVGRVCSECVDELLAEECYVGEE